MPITRERGRARQLAKRFRVSLTFIENLLKRYRTDGTVEARAHGGGQVAKISPEQEAVLMTLIEENNDAIKARAMRPTRTKCWRAYQPLHNGAIRSKAQAH